MPAGVNKVLSATHVMGARSVCMVRGAIDLDDQPRRDTGKVSDVGTDGVLAPEPKPSHAPASERAPQGHLGEWHVFAGVATECNRAAFFHASRFPDAGVDRDTKIVTTPSPPKRSFGGVRPKGGRGAAPASEFAPLKPHQAPASTRHSLSPQSSPNVPRCTRRARAPTNLASVAGATTKKHLTKLYLV